jgi:ribosome-binding ATPase
MYRCNLVLLKRRGAGIVGLPNIGKSTLFNALTCSQQAKTGNFPFCTIDANLARVPVYDERLRKLAAFTGAQKIVDVEVDLADVAGLIAGASKGEGLGNKFLNDIRPCNIILHLVRCFESAKDGFDAPLPLNDIAVIMNELVLSDLELMEKRHGKLARGKKATDPEVIFSKKVVDWLTEGKPVKDLPLSKSQQALEASWVKEYDLLSSKPMLYVLNVDDESVKSGNAFSKIVEDAFGQQNTVRVSAAIEEQTSQMGNREERMEFLKAYDIDVPSADVLMGRVHTMLDLQSFFTVGPLMAHGWSVKRGATAKEASGEIHGDFEKHFLSAKVARWDKFVTCANLASAEMLMEGVGDKYVMQDGEVFIVQHDARK